MSEIALYEAKARLSAIVEQVQATGQEVVINRRGKPVARTVTPAAAPSAVSMCK